MSSELAIVLSAEHASNAVPPRLLDRFRDCEPLLTGHRGYDPGTAEAAAALAARLNAPLISGEYSRLVIDLNRSPHHRRLYSEFTLALPGSVRRELLTRIYEPFRARVKNAVAERLDTAAAVLHVSVHSFVPALGRQRRNAEVGLLYDPRRVAERELAGGWQRELSRRCPRYRTRRNYPYRGAADGHTTALRKCWPDPRYLGIELELNQGLWSRGQWPAGFIECIGDTLDGAIDAVYCRSQGNSAPALETAAGHQDESHETNGAGPAQ